MEKIIYEEILDHLVTAIDRKNRIGYAGLVEKLQAEGWADENENALKKFKLQFRGVGNKVTWTATLVDEGLSSPPKI